jgi:hypothetical protein
MAKATADQIRNFAESHYVRPNRTAGIKQITIRAGDIHKRMGLTSPMPQVCGAIGSNKFQSAYNVRLINRTGPTNGADVYFIFGI